MVTTNRYLLSHTGAADRFNFPFVDVKRVAAFKYTALPSIHHDDHRQQQLQQRNSSSSSSHTASGMVAPSDENCEVSSSSLREASSVGSSKDDQSDPRSSPSCWNTDGEFIENPNIVLWVHRGLISLFARGIEP